MDRMIVCGWNEDAVPLLQALREGANLEAVAVGDPHPVHLVRAHAATKLACFQHLRQMTHAINFDAALLATSDFADEVATTAAIRDADLMLLGEKMNAESLQAAATASFRHGSSLAVLRPMLRKQAFSFVTDLIDANPLWMPTILDIDLRDQRSATALLRDAVAAVVRLVDQDPREVVASAAGMDPEEPAAVATQLRYEGGSLVTISARGFSPHALRFDAQARAGTIEVDGGLEESRVAVTAWGAEPERSVLREHNALEREASRVARIRSGDPLDARFALREASVLRAIEESLATAMPIPVKHASTRSTFRVLRGDSCHATGPRLGNLRVLTTAGA
jgi:hypothetical protein